MLKLAYALHNSFYFYVAPGLSIAVREECLEARLIFECKEVGDFFLITNLNLVNWLFSSFVVSSNGEMC